MLCDIELSRARERQATFYPDAEIVDDYLKVLARDDIEVVDVATPPAQRGIIIEAALRARKHVLSQKPFAVDLDDGQRLVDLADTMGVQLAVNQNGRWAPHYSFMLQALRSDLIGAPVSVAFSVHWDHQWVAGTAFENVKHLILYDFAIHWFDLLTCFMADKRPRRVFASFARAAGQSVHPALMGQALIEYDDAQAAMTFDGATKFAPEDRTYLRGTAGTIVSIGPDCRTQTLTIHTPAGIAQPQLKGCWFPDGFHGTMGELLCAIEEGRESTISARHNLASLALCFATVASAEGHAAVVPGRARRLP
jgi:predicted dehydrogenase